MENVQQD